MQKKKKKECRETCAHRINQPGGGRCMGSGSYAHLANEENLL